LKWKKQKTFKTESGLFVQGNYSYVIITKVAFRPSLEQLEHLTILLLLPKFSSPKPYNDVHNSFRYKIPGTTINLMISWGGRESWCWEMRWFNWRRIKMRSSIRKFGKKFRRFRSNVEFKFGVLVSFFSNVICPLSFWVISNSCLLDE